VPVLALICMHLASPITAHLTRIRRIRIRRIRIKTNKVEEWTCSSLVNRSDCDTFKLHHQNVGSISDLARSNSSMNYQCCTNHLRHSDNTSTVYDTMTPRNISCCLRRIRLETLPCRGQQMGSTHHTHRILGTVHSRRSHRHPPSHRSDQPHFFAQLKGRHFEGRWVHIYAMLE
jgi:hypothetical protein